MCTLRMFVKIDFIYNNNKIIFWKDFWIFYFVINSYKGVKPAELRIFYVVVDTIQDSNDQAS